MTLKHISHGNKVWMPVNHEKQFSGHDDEHDDEHDEKGHLYKGCALIGTRFVQMFIQKLLPAKFCSALTTANRSEFSLSKSIHNTIRFVK